MGNVWSGMCGDRLAAAARAAAVWLVAEQGAEHARAAAVLAHMAANFADQVTHVTPFIYLIDYKIFY